MLIRRATPADIPAMMELEKRAATAGHWTSQQYHHILGQRDPARRTAALVIEEEKSIVGFLIARSVDSEWELENVAIAGPARRQGLGSRLLGEFIDLVRGQGATAIFLEVRESNQAARMLYEKWAFLKSGRRTRYYSDPVEDAILYRFELP